LDTYVSVSEVLTADPVTVATDEDLGAASELMKEHAIRRLPVCDSGRVVGFISLGDLSSHVDADATLTEINAAPANG
jgi:CBS domain-containing protein